MQEWSKTMADEEEKAQEEVPTSGTVGMAYIYGHSESSSTNIEPDPEVHPVVDPAEAEDAAFFLSHYANLTGGTCLAAPCVDDWYSTPTEGNESNAICKGDGLIAKGNRKTKGAATRETTSRNLLEDAPKTKVFEGGT